MKVLRSFSGLVAVLLLISAKVYACSCAGKGAVCEEYWKTSAVFVGTVIESKTVTIRRGDYDAQQRLVRFFVDEPFRGVEGAEVEVMTGMGDGDCGIGFKQTGQYLVYASLYEGKLYTGICSRTKPISAAGGDLEYMRGLKDAKPGGAVYGEVSAYQRNDNGDRTKQLVAGAKILLEGPDNKETITDSKGAYRLEALPAGDYTVKIKPPESKSTRQSEQKISLSNGGCSIASFWLENDGQFNGRVFNPQGLPVKNAELFLMEFDKERYRGHSDAAYSDDDGRYAFKLIPPGRYILSIRFDGMTSQNRPFPVMYYPGVSDRAQAKVITVGEGQTIAGYDLEMPPLPLEFEVAGSVMWANGKPALGARVEYSSTSAPVSYGVKNEGANFAFKAYEGLKLALRASLEPEKGKYVYSEWVHITVAPGAPAVRLVLPQP